MVAFVGLQQTFISQTNASDMVDRFGCNVRDLKQCIKMDD